MNRDTMMRAIESTRELIKLKLQAVETLKKMELTLALMVLWGTDNPKARLAGRWEIDSHKFKHYYEVRDLDTKEVRTFNPNELPETFIDQAPDYVRRSVLAKRRKA